MPIFPLEGVLKEKLDSIQQEIFWFCNEIVDIVIVKHL